MPDAYYTATVHNFTAEILYIDSVELDIGGVFDTNKSSGAASFAPGSSSAISIKISSGSDVQGIYLRDIYTQNTVKCTLHCQWPTDPVYAISIYVGYMDSQKSCTVRDCPYIAGAHWAMPAGDKWNGVELLRWVDSNQLEFNASISNVFALLETDRLAYLANYGREVYTAGPGSISISYCLRTGTPATVGEVALMPGTPTYNAGLWDGVFNK